MPESQAADLAARLVQQQGSREAARSFLLSHFDRRDHDDAQLGRLLAAVSRVPA